MPRRFHHVAAVLMVAMMAAPPAAASPSCELLRKCSGALAEAYRESGFPARVVRQYRRNSTAPFERGEAVQPGLCRRVLKTIVVNAVEMHKRGRLKYVPSVCLRK